MGCSANQEDTLFFMGIADMGSKWVAGCQGGAARRGARVDASPIMTWGIEAAADGLGNANPGGQRAAASVPGMAAAVRGIGVSFVIWAMTFAPFACKALRKPPLAVLRRASLLEMAAASTALTCGAA